MTLLDDIITFFGSLILLAVLMLVIAYMLEYHFGSNAWYAIAMLCLPAIHYVLFRGD